MGERALQNAAGKWKVDVEEFSLRVEWSVTATIIPVAFEWNDLDFVGAPGGILGMTIDPSSTWQSPVPLLSFGAHFVHMTAKDRLVTAGDFLLLNLQVTQQVPEPASLVLAVMGLAGLAAASRRKRAK